MQKIPYNGISFALQVTTAAHGAKYKYPVAGSSRALAIIIMVEIIKPMARMHDFMMSRESINMNLKYRHRLKEKW